MPNLEKWWHTWAPFWEHLEDRHFGALVADRMADDIQSPVLVVGAGQGLVVERLRGRGMRVEGVDFEREMIVSAKARRGLGLLLANAHNLPFGSEIYRTVIIVSGVVDYLEDDEEATRIVQEALRVLSPGGMLIIAFYKLSPLMEEVSKKIGVLVNDKEYFIGRLFEVFEQVERSPAGCVKLIVKWTGAGFLPTLFYWAKLGLFLPKELKKERRQLQEVFEKAEKAGVKREELLGAVPEVLPYWGRREVIAFLDKCDISSRELWSSDSCRIVRHKKPGGEWGKAYETTEWTLTLRQLTKRYKGAKRNAVQAVELEVEREMVFGILGPNGAGKTTILKMMCGLCEPTSGEITFFGKESLRDIRHSMGYVPQDLAVYSKLSGKDNLRFFGKLYGIEGAELDKQVARLLEIVGLEDRQNDLVATYSQGMKRRLNLAAGLVHEPRMILLDEPTVGIDPQSRNRIFETVRNLRDGGMTILYTTHYMEEAARICDQVAIMDEGRVLLKGTPAELVKEHGAHRIHFEVDNLEDEVLGAITRMTGVREAKEEAGLLTAVLSGRIDNMGVIDEIKKLAGEKQMTLSLKSVEEPDLETLFLDLTGRRLRDDLL
ncbi:MAG: ATP-binding cassette domain-containing protein [Deltaproteobacteria bacterium]|nr:ATP-binding cassette domain-containing protein [Deltaproteobacteria bacterium]